VTLTGLIGATVLLGGLADPAEPTEAQVNWIKTTTGAAFLIMAVVKWIRRPRPGDPPKTPRWIAELDGYTPRRSARLGALLAGANPKNLLMAVAAGAEIALLAESTGAAVAAAAGFIAVASIGVATPITARAVLGERADPVLRSGRAWLDRNSTALSVGVLSVLGVALLGRGLAAGL
jgi:threonine/homoserine/homoserine lactone efflux protein